jgi:exopolysaccharide biosynthesis protein
LLVAVGVKEEGSVFIAVVDGVELLKEGLDLYEWSEILIEQGAVQAINLDGGGSSAISVPSEKILEQADRCRHLGNILTVQKHSKK